MTKRRFAGAIGRILSRADYRHFEASDPNAALGLADLYPFSLVLCDINMPGGSGLEMLRALRRLHPDIAVVMVTGMADKGTAGRAAEFGASATSQSPSRPRTSWRLSPMRFGVEKSRWRDELVALGEWCIAPSTCAATATEEL